MTIYEFQGHIPSVASTTYVDENATIVGDVRIGAQCYIGAGARLRGDYGSIIIGDKTSVQENCVLHARISEKCEVGSHVQIGHGAAWRLGLLNHHQGGCLVRALGRTHTKIRSSAPNNPHLRWRFFRLRLLLLGRNPKKGVMCS